MASPTVEHYAFHGGGNWVWLANPDRFERAVDVGGSALHAYALAEHFTQVFRVGDRANPDGLDTGRVIGAAGCLPLATASSDCVALRGPLGADGPEAAARALGEARRVLREGGCVSFGFVNARWATRARAAVRTSVPHGRARTLSLADARRLSRRAGFRRMDVFYVDPTFAAPSRLIEPTRLACGVFEKLKPVPSRSGSVRWLLAQLGCHSLLYPAYLCLAYV